MQQSLLQMLEHYLVPAYDLNRLELVSHSKNENFLSMVFFVAPLTACYCNSA